jgi:uncharacterized integral membrane protein
VSRTLRALVAVVGIAFLLGLGAVTGYFLIQNGQWVVLRFPALGESWDQPLSLLEFESPLGVIMGLAFVAGFLVAMLLLVIPAWMRRGVERRRERRFIRGLEGELVDLRNLAVDHPAPLEDVPETPPAAGAEAEAAEEEQALLVAALHDLPARRGER